jgi:hypothetical protein
LVYIRWVRERVEYPGSKKEKDMKQHCTVRIITLACLVAGIVGVSPALKAADEAGVSKLLADAKTQSYAVSVDASTLDSFLRSNISWQSHAAELNRMKDDINATAKTVTALVNAKAQAAPWQATAIDRIIPFMKEIAADTTAAIEYLNKNQSRLTMKEYKDYTQENAATSQELSTLIAHFVDYGNHKSRYESLKNSLELPAK